MSGHAILKNLYEKKMDVILTISFKITAEIEIKKTYVLRPTSRCIGFVKHMFFHSFVAMKCLHIGFFFFLTINSSVNAARSSLNHVYLRKFHGKSIKFIKTFRLGYVISLNVVVVKSNSDVLTVLGSSSAQYLFFSVFVLFCCFSINMYLNNCI